MKKVFLLLFIMVFLTELFPAKSTLQLNLQDRGSDRVYVCTFNGKGTDVIHEVVVEYKSSIRITTPGQERIKRVLYDRKMLNVTDNLHEVIVRPKQEKLTAYLAILTGEHYIYFFRVKTKAVKKGDKAPAAEQQIIIRR